MRENEVLLVDDNFITRETLLTFLLSQGISADGCEGGASALEMIGQNKYAVLVIDYRMPGMSGEELTRRIRATNRDVYIIGYSFEVKDRAFLNAGADAFLIKDNLIDSLVPMIKNRSRDGVDCLRETAV